MVSPISHWVITQLPDASFLLALILKWLRLLFGSRGVPPILQTSPNHREPVLTSTPSPGPTTYSGGRPTVNSKRPAESMNQAEGVRPKISHKEDRWTSSAVTTACPTTTFLKRKRVGFYDLGESVGSPRWSTGSVNNSFLPHLHHSSEEWGWLWFFRLHPQLNSSRLCTLGK